MINCYLNRVVKASMFFFGMVFSTTTFGQVDVVATAGTPVGSYTTLKLAFDAINAGTHQGDVGIGIAANTTETAPAVLNSSGAGAALYTSVLIQPINDGVSISGATTAGRGLIELKGADNVTIDGDNPNTGGVNRNLTIVNTAVNTVAYTSVIRIATAATVVTSANNISVLNCIINGNATGRNVAGTTSTTGSENTTFGIYVGGNGGASDIDSPAALTSVTTNTAAAGTTVNTLIVSNNAVNSVARGIVFNGANATVSSGVTITNNLVGDQLTTLVGNAPFTAATTTVYTKGIFIAGTTNLTITGNTLKNIYSFVSTATNAIELNGSIAAAGGSVNISDNTIIGIATNGTGGAATGIFVNSCTQPYTFNNNTITTVQTVGSVSAAGINIASSTAASGAVAHNRISNIYALSTGAYAARGIVIGAGNNVTIENNTIWDLNAANNNSITSTIFAVKGIGLNGGTGHKVYHNTVSLYGAMLSANVQADNTACLVISTTSQTGIDVRNNIFSNTMTGPAATVHGCIQLPSGGSAAMNLTLNNNAYYRGGAANSYYAILQATFTGYDNLLTMRAFTSTLSASGTNDNASIASTAAAPFVSASDLHINTGVAPTQLESGGAVVGVATDIDGQTRPGPAGSVNGGGTAPDMGADEFDGVPLTAPTVTLNSVTPPASAQCVAAARLVSVNVANTSGTVTAVDLAYSVNGVVQTPIAMVNTSGTTWEATIPAAVPGNATISWTVSATNSFAISGTYTGTSYSDEPLLGSIASASASSTTVCSGSPTTLTAAVIKPINANLGSSLTASSNSPAVTPFYGGYGGVKTQYLIRASELTAAGLVAGNITQLAMTVVSAGSTLNGFAISAENTALNVLTTNIENVGTQVYSTASYVPVVGVNNFPLSTPINWDGTSNIIISMCWSNNNTSNTFTSVLISTTSFVSANARYVDSRTSADVCGYIGNTTPGGWNGASTTVSSRPNFILTGNGGVAITSVSWSDGVGTVGTGTPLVVNPITTTTFTATIVAAGCSVTPNPTTTVTVNPLPTAPTATNSAQCGTQIPTASVTSTTGLPTPTFVWYDAAVAGTALQTSTSATYTTNVAATATFYVSELNTVTGCESNRTPVTVTVSTADGVSAVASPPAICIGDAVALIAANTNPTPNQTYSYTWSGGANSGASTPVAGSTVFVTPTQPGTYTYDLAAVDGSCNAVATVNVTVNPVVATLAPINVTCNGYNNGSFSVASTSCGTEPFEYSVNAGTFGPIPTNLAPATYSVVVRDFNGYLVPAQNVVITEPSTIIAAPIGTNAAVCVGDLSAQVAATSSTNTLVAGTPVVVSFDLAAQPTEVNAAPGVIISSATIPALPAGAVITSLTLSSTGIIPNGGEYQSDVKLGLSGAYANTAASGTGTTGFGTVSGVPYNYTRLLTPTATFPTNGGNLNLLYWNDFNDVSGGPDATFPLGASAVTLTINYSVPVAATVTWWTASTAGTQIGSGSPFETVGTSVLPNTNTPGVYTVYAQGEFGGCNGLTRTPVTVTVNVPSASTTTATACGSYTWTNGTSYTSSGVYTQTLVNAVGCDSIATLNLTINQPSASALSATACGSYTWAENGTTYTASGSYTDVLTNAAGCDSTITLNLTINQPTSSSLTETACGSYTWAENGTTYTASGSYTDVLTNAAGCDSTITLNLTINQPTSSSLTETACGSYTWAENGTTYTASGSYTDVLTNAAGCDSTITLNLTINQATSSSLTETACGSYTWAENGTTYTASGSYTDVLTNAAGCDSIITLNLTINQATSSSVTASACDTYTWAENAMTYTASGAYSVVLTNSAGCDSSITLNLTITNSPVATATDNLDATITASTGTSYQWIDCATNTPIAGATSQTFTATANGEYAVTVTTGGCSDTSPCVTIDYIGIKELSNAGIRIAPNPTNGDVFITMTNSTEATIEIVDAQGKLLNTVKVVNGEKVSLASYDTGVYFLRINTDKGSVIEPVVKY